MSNSFEKALGTIISGTYVKQGVQNRRSRDVILETLLISKRLPAVGLSTNTIEYILRELSNLDSNNFYSNVGVGEREGRVFSDIVAARHYNLSHGIGRSGNLSDTQPKAAGSSAIYKLTTQLVSHALQLSGLHSTFHCNILPLATGMSIAMCLLCLKSQNNAAKYVVWSRIDQKSCFKSIILAGLTPLVVDMQVTSDGGLVTDVQRISDLLVQFGDEVLCVLSTTSCFAPRQPDRVDEIAELCAAHNVGHIVNNAYGTQCRGIVKLINRAAVKGRVDAVTQSGDKNFMVPVGAAIIASPNSVFLSRLSDIYPGRASISSVVDLLITLLAMGVQGYQHLLSERLRILPLFAEGLNRVATRHRLELLPLGTNTISMAVNMDSLVDAGLTEPALLGSMLFVRNVSGCRVVCSTDCDGSSRPLAERRPTSTTISGHVFTNWGSHSSAYPHTYFTVACSMGMKEEESIKFLEKLNKVLLDLSRKNRKITK